MNTSGVNFTVISGKLWWEGGHFMYSENEAVSGGNVINDVTALNGRKHTQIFFKADIFSLKK